MSLVPLFSFIRSADKHRWTDAWSANICKAKKTTKLTFVPQQTAALQTFKWRWIKLNKSPITFVIFWQTFRLIIMVIIIILMQWYKQINSLCMHRVDTYHLIVLRGVTSMLLGSSCLYSRVLFLFGKKSGGNQCYVSLDMFRWRSHKKKSRHLNGPLFFISFQCIYL